MTVFTEEVRRVLEAPFEKSVIKSFQGKGGKTMKYIDVEVLEDRVREVDPDFGRDVQLGAKGVAVHYTILGVRRGDAYDNDSESNKYGAPQVNALARACRRALRLFGIAKDLWQDDDEDDEEADEKPARGRASSSSSAKRSTSSSTRSGGGPSEPQLKLLVEVLGADKKLARKLDGTGGRDSQASKVITFMLAARNDDKDAYDEDALAAMEGFYASHKKGYEKAIVQSALDLIPDSDDDDDDDASDED